MIWPIKPMVLTGSIFFKRQFCRLHTLTHSWCYLADSPFIWSVFLERYKKVLEFHILLALSDLNLNDLYMHCVSTEDGGSQCGSEDWRAGRVWEDLQKRYCPLYARLFACVVSLVEWVCPHCSLCVISNQHGLTMPMHALYSMQELGPWKQTSQGTVL